MQDFSKVVEPNKMFKDIVGIISVATATVAYFVYIRDILFNQTKPHVVTWGIWTVLSLTTFSIQLSEGAGPGAWSLGASGALSLVVTLLAISKGSTKIDALDWLNAALAGSMLGIWLLASSPLFAMTLIVGINTLGFIPTFRKTYKRPLEETASMYLLSGMRALVSIFALQNYDLVNLLHPLSATLVSFLFLGVIYARRIQTVETAAFSMAPT